MKIRIASDMVQALTVASVEFLPLSLISPLLPSHATAVLYLILGHNSHASQLKVKNTQLAGRLRTTGKG